jgi:hypothetical protein
MYELKTKPTVVAVDSFIDAVPHPQRREDARTVRAMMERLSGYPAAMWGPSIVGFGTRHYKYASGREGVVCLTGFSPRSGAIVVYLGPGIDNDKLMAKLGKHKHGKGCLYINKLDDVDRDVLRKLIEYSTATLRKRGLE